MKKINYIIVFIGLAFVSLVHADDTDIYLESDGARANPPYLMLMIDYRPSVFIPFCSPLSECAGKMTESSFAKLCSIYAKPAGVTRAQAESACRFYYQNIEQSGAISSQSTTL